MAARTVNVRFQDRTSKSNPRDSTKKKLDNAKKYILDSNSVDEACRKAKISRKTLDRYVKVICENEPTMAPATEPGNPTGTNGRPPTDTTEWYDRMEVARRECDDLLRTVRACGRDYRFAAATTLTLALRALDDRVGDTDGIAAATGIDVAVLERADGAVHRIAANLASTADGITTDDARNAIVDVLIRYHYDGDTEALVDGTTGISVGLLERACDTLYRIAADAVAGAFARSANAVVVSEHRAIRRERSNARRRGY